MKRLIKKTYTTKHPGKTFPFHPGNVFNLAELERIPARGKDKKKILPAMRDRRIINTSLLCKLLKKFVPHNVVDLIPGGLEINHNTITMIEGLAVINGKTKFRYNDLFECLNVIIHGKEKILDADYFDLRKINTAYYEALEKE